MSKLINEWDIHCCDCSYFVLFSFSQCIGRVCVLWVRNWKKIGQASTWSAIIFYQFPLENQDARKQGYQCGTHITTRVESTYRALERYKIVREEVKVRNRLLIHFPSKNWSNHCTRTLYNQTLSIQRSSINTGHKS